ncbi:MAG: hypothetical protein AABX97_03325, partial [Candidatus Thermoplasmatota archaeon]
MQPSSQPPSVYMPPPPRRYPVPIFLALGAIALVLISGVGGYLLGSAGLGQATLRINVTNNFGSSLTVSVTVNTKLVTTMTLAADQTGSVDSSVTYATANGAYFDVEAAAATGPRDSSTV